MPTPTPTPMERARGGRPVTSAALAGAALGRAALICMLAGVAAAESQPDVNPSPVTPSPKPSVPTISPAAPTPEAPRWDYLPTVGYDSDALWLSLRVGSGAATWTACGPGGAALTPEVGEAGATVSASLVPGARPRDASGAIDEAIEFSSAARAPAAGATRVRLARPGAGKGLGLDQRHRLALAGAPAILVVERTEAAADRRWRLFRAWSGTDPVACDLTIEAPAVPSGESGLLALICAAQRVELKDRSVLVLLPRSDIDAGWKHREYRQTLAWLVSDALARGALHVVLAGPIAPKAEADRLQPLQQPVADVAAAYHCATVDCSSLCADADWEISEGIIGPELNARGKRELEALLKRWRK